MRNYQRGLTALLTADWVRTGKPCGL